jgi:hypothetical protein
VDAHEVARLTFQKGGGDIRIIEPDVLLRQRVNQLLIHVIRGAQTKLAL